MKLTREEFCDALGDIRDDYVEAARQPAARRPAWLKWGLVAACVCLLVGATTVYAASGHGAWIVEMFTGRDESGYDLGLMIERVSTDEFSAELRAVGREIVQQYKDSKPYDSGLPGSWNKTFDTAAEARDFVGYAPLVGLGWALAETGTMLSVEGLPDGRLRWVHLETGYQVGDIRLQAFSQIYTEHYSGDLSTGIRAAEGITYTQSEQVNAAGLSYLVVVSTPMASGYAGLDGYLVRDGVLYSLHIAYLEKDAAEAERLMGEWANCF